MSISFYSNFIIFFMNVLIYTPYPYMLSKLTIDPIPPKKNFSPPEPANFSRILCLHTVRLNYYAHFFLFKFHNFLHECAHIYPLLIYVVKIDHRPLIPPKKNSPPRNQQIFTIFGSFCVYKRHIQIFLF